MRRTRRIGAYGICRDDSGRVLLARGSASSAFPGWWSLPGGTVEQGEAPAATVVRELAEETGLAVEPAGLRHVLADIALLPDGVAEHADRLVYDVRVVDGRLADEVGGSTDRAAWFAPAGLLELPVLPFTATVLGAGTPGPAGAWRDAAGAGIALPEIRATGSALVASPGGCAPDGAGQGAESGGAACDGSASAGPHAAPGSAPAVPRGQRFGAYALATDPAGRILLTEIAPGYPGAGRWHLPGGGTDHGEAPEHALVRELLEETGQDGTVTGLLDAAHRHDPAALGPEGHPIDWHVVRVLFRVTVGLPTEPVVLEAAGGSTRRAGWFAPERLAQLPVTEAVTWARRWLPDKPDDK